MSSYKILVAYDGSEMGKKALQKAIELAQTNPLAEIEVIHVVMIPVLYSYEGYFPSADLAAMALEKGDETISEVKQALSGIPNKWNAQLIEGLPAQKILEYVNQTECDLIIMGSRGLSDFKQFFLGSVSHNVVQHSPVAVLIIK